MQKEYFTCHSCGKKAEIVPEEPPCIVLRDWLMISHWKEPGSVGHYSFCSFTCLQRWVDAQVPKIPRVFLKSLGEEPDNTTNK